MQLTALSLALTRAGFLTGFNPLSLFSAGEPGVFFDPSDMSTMFQDAAGTTPVTAVEQPVGLLLDKSRGLVLGAELVDTASTAAGWIKYGNNTVEQDADAVKVTYVDNAQGAYVLMTGAGGLVSNPVVGTFYRITFEIRVNSGAAVGAFLKLGNVASLSISDKTSTTYSSVSITMAPSDAATAEYYFRFSNMGAGEVVWIRNISVKELPGAHASQTTNPDRPVLSARVNLLTKTEDFADSGWQVASSGGGIPAIKTPNYGVAPDGTTTACRVQLDVSAGAANDQSQMYRTYTTPTVGTLAPSAWFKTVDGSTKTIMGFTASGGTPLTITVTGTWTRIAGSRPTGGSSDNFQIILIKGQTSDTADLLVWHPDSRVSNVGTGLPAYQRVNTATDYDTVGFPLYLKFNGVNQSLVTPTITPGTDKAQVFAGVRKLSDAAPGIVAELSTTASNAGAFGLQAPNSSTNSYRMESSGTALQSVSATGYSAPITNVLFGSGDIAASSVSLRVNGALFTLSASQGTGNYGNYPLYIGRRAGSGLPFNGHLYSLAVRFGPNLTADQITQTESYVAGKTGVVLPVATFDFIITDAGDQVTTDGGDTVVTDTYFV